MKTKSEESQRAEKLKEEGNSHFKAGRYENALSSYLEALSVNPSAGPDTAVYHKNLAAVYLKLEQHLEAAKQCTKAIEITPNDPKALFRRCQAFEAMERYEDAYKDAMQLLRVDPKNTAIQPVLARLNPIIQDRINQQTLTDNKVSQMFDLAFKSKEEDREKRVQAANNLIVLAREEAGAENMYNSGGVLNLIQLMDGKDLELQITGIRALACLAQNSKKRAHGILEHVTLKKILLYIGVNDDNVSTAAANMLQNILASISDIEAIKAERDKYEEMRKVPGNKLRPFPFISEKVDESVRPLIFEIFNATLPMLTNKKVSAYGRDNIMEIWIKYITIREGLGWNLIGIENGAVQAVVEVGGNIPEHNVLPVTSNSRTHASLLLAKMYEDLYQDTQRDKFRAGVDAYFSDMFGDEIFESKIEAVMALACLLQGPFEIGNYVLGRTGVLEMILAMADSDNAMHVKYAVEALVYSTSKKDRCSGVLKQATPILKQLYQSKNDYVKVRALVGLCKLGSFGGSDASAKSLAEGSTLTLAKACRKFLKNPAKDIDLRKWAAEGLAYLSLDADVKEELVEDTEAISSMIELAKVPDKNVLYPVATVFVNLTNSYDQKDPEPEMVELAKFAKHHVPEKHEKDKEPYVSNRVKRLIKLGIVNALVALSKTESENSRELLARLFLAVADDQEHRGLIVQQGGGKALIPLALEGTKTGKYKASQALAKLAISCNPEIAFPGQRVLEVVRPVIQLLDVESTALENFEALMALTNLASVSDSVRKRVLKEKGFSKIEHYTYEEHEQLRKAALECICNLCLCDDTLEYFKQQSDRVKYFVLLCLDEDPGVVRACAGALAIISYDPAICQRIIDSTDQWFEVLQTMAAHPVPEFQHRGVHILMNMMAADKDIATRLVESTMFEILMAVSKIDDEEERKGARDCALKALQSAKEWKLIKENK